MTNADSHNALALVYLTNPATRKRDADTDERSRRLVACWNALIGTSTEDVEAMAAKAKIQRAA
jgi:hypothetical protein